MTPFAVLQFLATPSAALAAGVVDREGSVLRFPMPRVDRALALPVGSLRPSSAPATSWASDRLVALALAEVPRSKVVCKPPSLTPDQRRRRFEAARTALASLGASPAVASFANDLAIRAYGLADEDAEFLLGQCGMTPDPDARAAGRFYSPDELGAALDKEAADAAKQAVEKAKQSAEAYARATKTRMVTSDELGDGIAFFVAWRDSLAMGEGTSRENPGGTIGSATPRSAPIKMLPGQRELLATRSIGLRLDPGDWATVAGGVGLRCLPGDELVALTESEIATARKAQYFGGVGALVALRRMRGYQPAITTYLTPGSTPYKAALRAAGDILDAHLTEHLHVSAYAIAPVPLAELLVRGLQLEPAIAARVIADAARRHPDKGAMSYGLWASDSGALSMCTMAAAGGIVKEGELAHLCKGPLETMVDGALGAVARLVAGADVVRSRDVIAVMAEAGDAEAKAALDKENPGPTLSSRVTSLLEYLGFPGRGETTDETGNRARVYKRGPVERTRRTKPIPAKPKDAMAEVAKWHAEAPRPDFSGTRMQPIAPPGPNRAADGTLYKNGKPVGGSSIPAQPSWSKLDPAEWAAQHEAAQS